MKLSDLHPDEITPVPSPSQAPSASGGLRLSQLHPNDIQLIPKEAPGMLESGARGLAQGGTLGFADELAGAGGSLADAAKKMSLQDIVKDYIANRDAYRAKDAAAEKANPYTFGSGNLAGAIGTAIIPGLNIAKGATLGARAAGAAGLGAASALGSSRADLTQGDFGGAAKDTATGAALGAALQPAIEKVVAPAVGYLGGKAKDLAGWAGKKAINAGLDIPEHISGPYLNNSGAVNNALSKDEVAQKIADTFGNIKKDTGAANEAAMSTLSHERTPYGMSVRDASDTLRKFSDPRADALASKLETEYAGRNSGGLLGEATENSANLSDREMHEVKKVLQGVGEWNNPNPSYIKSEANKASGDINQALKSQNPDYKEAMSDLSQNIDTKKALAQKFGIVPDNTPFAPESGFSPTDKTMSALRDVGNANKIDRAKILESVKDQGYGDLAEDVKNSLAKQRLEGGATNGSRKAVIGYALGNAAGHFTGIPGASQVGGALGAISGGMIDKYGGPIAKGLLDATELTQKLASNPTTQKFVGAIQSAASKGQGALAATHFILSQTEPEYQKAVQSQ